MNRRQVAGIAERFRLLHLGDKAPLRRRRSMRRAVLPLAQYVHANHIVAFAKALCHPWSVQATTSTATKLAALERLRPMVVPVKPLAHAAKKASVNPCAELGEELRLVLRQRDSRGDLYLSDVPVRGDILKLSVQRLLGIPQRLLGIPTNMSALSSI